MSLFICTSRLYFLLIAFACLRSSLQHVFKGTVIQNFTSLIEEDVGLPKTHVCTLGLPARRERCAAAAKSSDCSEYGCKILFGTPGKPFTYEFVYVNPKDGKKSEKKWGVRCPSRPVMFLTAGESDDHYEVMILKPDPNTDPMNPVMS